MKNKLPISWDTLLEDINEVSPLKEYLNHGKDIVTHATNMKAIKLVQNSWNKHQLQNVVKSVRRTCIQDAIPKIKMLCNLLSESELKTAAQ